MPDSFAIMREREREIEREREGGGEGEREGLRRMRLDGREIGLRGAKSQRGRE